MVWMCACSPSSKTEVKDTQSMDISSLKGDINRILDSVYSSNPEMHGIVMHVESPDLKLSWGSAAGWSCEEQEQRMTSETPFLIASITKMYVATAILRLVESNKLKLESTINTLLTDYTVDLLRKYGYKPDEIEVKHLLSNTSGIYDYTNTLTYQNRSVNEPNYEWTRIEQITLALDEGHPLGEPEYTFQHSETNFLLLAEIIENATGKPFHLAINALIGFNKHKLDHTWFNLLDNGPDSIPQRAQQFARAFNADSYEMHGSFDLFGGGGIISTAADLAQFVQLLLNDELFTYPGTLQLMHTHIETNDSTPSDYELGLMTWKMDGKESFGHGGFWGSMVQYIPSINTSISICVMERDYWPLNLEIISKTTALIEAFRSDL